MKNVYKYVWKNALLTDPLDMVTSTITMKGWLLTYARHQYRWRAVKFYIYSVFIVHWTASVL